jgi:hypothetical protein
MIRRSLFAVLLLWAASTIPTSAQRVDYQKADSLRVVSLFKKASGQQHSMGNYMVFFGRQLRGVPYVAKTLEVNKEERLVVNLRQLDCTTYVETVLALSRCMMQGKPTFANYCTQLRLIRYARGVVSYPTRQHYFTYWIKQNVSDGIVKDIQSPNPPFTARQTVKANYMTTHVSQYPLLVAHPAFVGKIKAMEQSITGMKPRYIPEQNLKNTKLLRSTVHDGDIIGIVTMKAGLEISHLGIAVWHKDGLHMLNASSMYHKVVEDNNLLYTYLKNKKTSTGIRIARAY